MEAHSLNARESAVLDYITKATGPVTLKEIAGGLFPGEPPVKGNSIVRNGLRRLRDKLGLVRKVDKGTYAPPVRLEIVQPKGTNPMPLTTEQLGIMEAARKAERFDLVLKIKSPDCTFYNDCLTVARDNNWPGFGCTGCSSFEEPDVEQKVSDMLALTALSMASEHEATEGCAGRKRGVKPGADAKVRSRKLTLVPADGLIRRAVS